MTVCSVAVSPRTLLEARHLGMAMVFPVFRASDAKSVGLGGLRFIR
ncbi:MAG: hypothetical protein WA418_10785 [Bradyrhizobium sp.]